MIDINTARNTILHLLNKTNRGYISPEEFNNFCNLAQLAIFEDLFFKYNKFINNQNKRLTNGEYADIPKNIREQIDYFTVFHYLSYNSSDDLYNHTLKDFYRTISLSLETTSNQKRKDVEEISKSRLNLSINSNVVGPTVTYPEYIKLGDKYRLFPKVSAESYKLQLLYIRTPKFPKWTYININGNPIYNNSASDIQHIELSESLFEAFIVKVMLYAGFSIREQDVVQASVNEEAKMEAKVQQNKN